MRQALFAILATPLLGPVSAQEVAAPAASSPAQVVAASPLGTCFRRQPAYPIQALRKGQQGSTQVAFSITPAGEFQDPAILRSSGHPALDYAALAHLNKCIAASGAKSDEPLPSGRYALPMVWRIE
jgi:bla regulator protein blaR1